jgi:hypothetical protein
MMAVTLLAVALAPATGEATPIVAVYQFSAQDFLDSNFNPPQGSTSTAVAGTFTFTFDDTVIPHHEIVPDSVLGVDLTYFDGTMMDFDETNSGVNVDFGNNAGEFRITFGATVNAVSGMVGLSNDFRVRFDIDSTNGTLISVVENFTFNSTTDPFYTGPTTMILVAYQAVPEPSPALLLGLGVVGLAVKGRRAR